MTDESQAPFGDLGTRDELRAASVKLVEDARRSVHIYTRDMDPQVYDHEPFLEALKRFAISHRNAVVRIICQDLDGAIRDDHRLIHLVQKLSSRIAVREPGRQHREYNAAFLVADGRGVVYRELGDRFQATASANDPGRARQLVRYHDEVWEFGSSNPNMRILGF